jgi:hypothetical protein
MGPLPEYMENTKGASASLALLRVSMDSPPFSCYGFSFLIDMLQYNLLLYPLAFTSFKCP